MVRKSSLGLFVFILMGQLYGQLISNHKVIYYSSKEFKGHNQTWQAAQADNGLMYFANGDGLLQYDGVEWSLTLTARKTNMLSLGIDANNRIYYGAIGEVGYFEKNAFGRLIPVQILNEEYETTMTTEFYWNVHIFDDQVIFRSEHLWIVYEGGKSAVIPVEDMVIKSSFQVDDHLWVQDNKGVVYKIHHDSLKYLSEVHGVKTLNDSFKGVSIQGLERYDDDKIMMTGQGIRLMLYDESTNTLEHFESQLDDLIEPGFYLNDLEVFPDKSIGVSTTTNGVYILNAYGRIVSVYNEENGLSSNAVRNMYFDREGLIWFTSDVGIYKVLFNKNYTLLTQQYKDISGISNAILEFKGQLVVATNENVYFIRNNNGELKTYPLEGFNQQSFDLLEINDQLICATTSGLFLLENDSFKELSPKYARALVKVSDNYLLVGGRKAIYLWKRKGKAWELVKNIEFTDEFLHLEKDPTSDNVFWGGLYSSGLVRIKVDTIQHTIVYRHYDEEVVGFPGYVLPFSIQDRMIFAPKTEEIWEYNAENDDFVKDQFTESLLKEVHSSWLIKEDVYGNIFYEASGPVYFCRKKDNNYEVDSASLSNLNVGYINDIYCSETGETWLVAEENIIRFNPHLQKGIDLRPKVIIKRVIINGDSLLYEGYLSDQDSLFNTDLSFDYEHNNLTFDFVAPFHTDEEPLQYSFKLKGNDNGFSPWSNDHKAVYTNLLEGEYTLQIKAKNAAGVESDVIDFSFTILPPWYRTWYAYGFFLVVLIIFVVAIVKLNSLRLRKANDKLQKVVEEKTHEISLNLKEISLQKDQLEERNNDIIDSINYAQRLQNAILPSKEEIDQEFEENFVLYLPKDIVAGDFYWLHSGKEKTFIAAADCTGHGVPGALVSVVCNDALNQAANEFKLDQPDLILNTVNDLVKKMFSSSKNANEDLEVRDGMDIALAHINTESREVVFSGAHNGMWILSKHDHSEQVRLIGEEGEYRMYEVKADRQPIGSSYLEKKFTRSTVKLMHDDKIYMFTDGIIDQFGGEAFGKIKKFKRKNLMQLLFETSHLTMSEQRHEVEKVFHQWKGEEEQLDDVTLIGIKL